MDQGVLVQLVLEDTEVRAIHHMNLPRTGEHATYNVTGLNTVQPVYFVNPVKATPMADGSPLRSRLSRDGARSESPPRPSRRRRRRAVRAVPKRQGRCGQAHFETTTSASTCCTTSTEAASKPKSDEVHTVSIEVPEIASSAIAGEWLIPNDGILLVSFGPHTVAGKDGKAVIRERLAIIEAEGDVEKSVQRNIPVVPRLSLIPVPAAPIAERP